MNTDFRRWISLVEAILPMDPASRLLRAEAMGFDVTTRYYHGTPSSENIRALQRGNWERVPGEPFYFDDMVRNPNALRWVPSPPEKQQIWFTPDPKYAFHYAQRGMKGGGAIYPVFLRKDAITAPALKSLRKKEVYVTDPAAVRSIHATFDPARGDDTDLLA